MDEYLIRDRSGRLETAQTRSDVAVEYNLKLAETIRSKAAALPQALRKGQVPRDQEQLKIRRALIESEISDPNGLERILGASDLLSVNYLTRGARAAAAVCRIRVPTQGGEWYGSGFLVGPRLLMTNNHVLSSRQEASQTEAEFNYEHDVDGVLNPPVQFNLAPHEIFFTDVAHDVTFVAVAPFSESGVPLERFGYLPLIPLSGKGIAGEWVTIIQHPGGEPKQMTVRNSRIITLDSGEVPDVADRYIHYTTDTNPGSSGAPVLNDQWQVVAIHHKAIPDPSSIQDLREGRETARTKWLANQGVRISAIYQKLEGERFSNEDAAAVLDRLSRSLGLPPLPVSASTSLDGVTVEKEGKPLSADHWHEAEFGYDADFLAVKLDLDTILSDRREHAAKLKGSDEVVLDYLHFSSVIDRDRRFPMLTAVNIHGAQLRHPGSTSNSWRRDIRLDEKFQPGDNFYVRKLGDDPVTFDRGHLVRRLNPCWGDTAAEVRLAEKHTFHFSNAAPQVHHYNDIEWGDLEDYVLDRTQTLEKKVTVFSGPVFKDQDPEYGFSREDGPWKIPVTFWKIAVIEKPDGKISAAAFIVGQVEYLEALFEARVFTGLKPYTFQELKTRKIQTTIETVENETGFDFSVLREFDALDALESTRQTRFIRHSSQIII